MSDLALKLVEYDADKGMVAANRVVTITLNDGTQCTIPDVLFYDTVRGFIQTKDGILYMPTQGKTIANN